MRKLLTIILMITILTGCSVSSDLPTETSVTDETTTYAKNTENPDFLYRINNDDVRIITYLGKESSVLIPSSIENHPVKAVQNIILKECVTELTYAEGITEINVPIGKSLKKINLPSTLEIIHIGENSNYHAITEVNISNSNKFMSKGGVLFSADEKTLIYYPCGRTGSYMIPDGTEIIGDNAFREALVEKVTFPESIKEIGKYAFKYCSKLISISFPKSLDKIGDKAFYSSGLNNVEFSEGVKEIGSSAFAETSLDEIVLPSSLKTVGNNIFGDADEEITIYADTSTESLEPLNCYENLIYRSETMLRKAIRLGKRMAEQKSFYDCQKALLFNDIDGDDFPELFTKDPWNAYCYKYSEKSGWQELFYVDCSGYCNSDIRCYRDKENNSHFYVQMYESNIVDYYLYADKITFDSSGEIVREMIGYSGMSYPIGSYYDNKGGLICYNGISGFEINEYSYNSNNINEEGRYSVFKKYVEKGLSDYELIKKIDFDEILNKYKSGTADNEGKAIFYDGVFADKLNVSKYNFTAPEKKVIFTIGESGYTNDSYEASLKNEEITSKNFEKLSQLPNLQMLNISADGEADLTGIEKLKNLKYIRISADSVKGTQSLIQLTKVEWVNLSSMENIDFLSDMDSVKVLEIPYTLAKPDDYFKPVYDMKSLKYIPVSVWEKTITNEQVKAINTNRPDVILCYYKIG